MRDISLESGINIENLKGVIEDLLEKDEALVTSCTVVNNAATTGRFATGILCGIGVTFNKYSDHFKILATNSRLFIVGINYTTNTLINIKEVKYSEIKKLKLSKSLNHIKLYLDSGEFLEMSPMSFSDNDEIFNKSVETFNYIKSKIDEEKIEEKSKVLSSDGVVLTGYSVITFFENIIGFIKQIK